MADEESACSTCVAQVALLHKQPQAIILMTISTSEEGEDEVVKGLQEGLRAGPAPLHAPAPVTGSAPSLRPAAAHLRAPPHPTPPTHLPGCRRSAGARRPRGAEHAQGRAVEHDDQHAGVRRTRVGDAGLKSTSAVRQPRAQRPSIPSATGPHPQKSPRGARPIDFAMRTRPNTSLWTRCQPLVYSRTCGPVWTPPPSH